MINKKYTYLLLYFIVGAVFYTFISYKLGINSDSASAILISKDGAEGNFVLNGWHLSTQAYYFTDLLGMTILFKIFGYNIFLAHFYAGLLYTTLVALSIKLLGRVTILGISVITGVIVLPSVYQSFSALVINIHIGTYVCALFCILMSIKFNNTNLLKYMVPVVIFSVLVIYSDSIYFYVFVLPLMIAAVASRFMGVMSNRSFIYIIFACVLIVLGGKFLGVLMGVIYHFQLPNPEVINNPAFQKQELIGHNVYLFFNGMSDYFNAKFYAQRIKTISGITSFFNFFSMTVFVSLIAICAVRSLKKDFATMLISSAAIVMIGAYLVSDLATDSASPRYFFFSLVTGAILIGRTLVVSHNVKYLLILLFLFSGVFKILPLKGDVEDLQYKQLHSYLQTSGLNKGYASFWNASSLTVLGGISVAPVTFGEGAHNMGWLSKDDWYKEDRNFIIYDNDSDYKHGINQFGEPFTILEFNGKKIAIYKKIIHIE